MNLKLKKNVFYLTRRLVRLGGAQTTLDGAHEDIRVAHRESHEKFHYLIRNFDIAIVYLKHDVTFNGKWKISI